MYGGTGRKEGRKCFIKHMRERERERISKQWIDEWRHGKKDK